ncbi:GDSL-type esterase/lipase family protein [Streptomyces sp. NPDC058045]|uniref:SGNH/GDSL hydrolase family protein n=1 Tax=Streptomyces sp. NPDC058045 TaxID=3346311 RepID=UPI0036E89238
MALLTAPPADARPAPGAASAASGAEPQPLPLVRLFDNAAVGDPAAPGRADFDGQGAALPAPDLAAAGWTPGRRLTLERAALTWPDRRPGTPDNVRADGQAVKLHGRGDALAFLVAGTGGTASGTGTVHYRDGHRGTFRLTAPDWRTGPLATKAVALPHVLTPEGPVDARARLYAKTVPVDPERQVVRVDLPRTGGTSGGAPVLHVFALTVRPATAGWSGTWAASTSGHGALGPWSDRTLRLAVHTSVGGARVRVRWDNTFAGAPVRIGRATVAVQSAGAEARGTPVPLSFDGAPDTVLPAGAQQFSDPLPFAVPAGSTLLVSFRLPETVASAPLHRESRAPSWVSAPGDHTGDPTGESYTAANFGWPLLAGVDVSGGPGSVALLGDSITDGVGSTPGADHRWPDRLAERLAAQRRVPHYGVLNEGISANRVLADRYPGDGVSTDFGGVSALHRLDRDLAAQTSVRTVVLFLGVNDVRWGETAPRVEAGLAELAGRARERGLRVLAATITPCEGEKLCTPAADAERTAVNRQLREHRADFDGLLDFDQVLRDPAHPSRLLPAYDSGDHLHPGDDGLAALADSVPLELL